ncbi:anaerobic selenocysteine-containing dehydrogenase [Paucibacter oligotrophus]|uniref:Anaerobic selenocysteine-containing dehydrogenase n=1 Tax=Roseateles oligotrophus TaxID=1769250 RepID=A0A840LEK6_9BURK|nr:molybdopterin-dependent oxidoreductase [Roseateles oligotrophus]MBB4844628.1 anaerobic selenocysteine-containing dehydrogenase [Roseateles oligotrophus]
MSQQSHYRICPLCEACCGLEIRSEGQRVLSIRGAENDVFSTGFICPKGISLKDLHEDPDRLRQPLIKRAGKFVPASWDEAFEEVERRLLPILREQGPDAVAACIGNPAAHKIGLLAYFPKLARALGTRNIFSASTLDQMPKQLSSGLMYGHWLSIAVPDLPRSDLLIILGANPLVSNGSLWTVPDYRGKARAMRERGGRIIVIDPRKTETAHAADEHLPIRPGGDVFLLLGMVHTLFDEGLVRLKHLAGHVKGLETLREAVLAYPPERMASGCAIPAETQRRLARELAATERASLYARIGSCTQRFGTLNSWLVDVINILTGHLDAIGGAMFPKAAAFAANTQGRPGVGKGISTGRRRSRVSQAPEVFGELPISCLAEEIETPGPGQVRALIAIASNPVLSAPNGPRIARALDSLDFMLSLDIYLNETSRHADVILPGLSPLEELHYDLAFPQLSWRNQARYSGPVFDKPAGQPEEWQTLLRLAALLEGRDWRGDVNALDDEAIASDLQVRMAEQAGAVLAALAPLRGPERLLDLALRSGPYGDQFGRRPEGLNLAKVKAAAAGIDLGELQPRIPELLRTPSGQIELAPQQLLDDLPAVDAALALPLPAMSLIGRRDMRSGNSWMHNLPVLAKGPVRCTLLVHPDDAAGLGLREGGRACVSTAQGELSVEVGLSADLMRGVLSLPHGWGHDLPGVQLALARQRPGANLNALLDDRARDPLSGNSVLSGVAVSVRPL